MKPDPNVAARTCVRTSEVLHRQFKIAASTQGLTLEEWALRGIVAQLDQPTAATSGPFANLTSVEKNRVERYVELMRASDDLSEKIDRAIAHFLMAVKNLRGRVRFKAGDESLPSDDVVPPSGKDT